MGEFKLTFNEQKIGRGVWSGKFDADELEASFDKVTKEFKKYPKGEMMALGIHTELDMRFLTSEMAKSLEDFLAFLTSYTKKTASVVPSFMLQKSIETAKKAEISNHGMFATEQEAVRWLLKD